MEVMDLSAKDKLKQYAARIESLESDKDEVMSNIRDIYKDAANDGFDVRVLKAVLKLKKMKREDRIEADELMSLYKIALDI